MNDPDINNRRLTPKWVAPFALAAFLFGLGTVVLGPPLIYAVASASADVQLPAEDLADEKARAEFLEQKTRELLEGWFWVFPVAGALGFGGMIGLILAWVSRPLGDDLEESP